MTAKRLTHTGVYTGIALAMYAFESMLPPLFAFAPGVKLGLSNAVVLFAIFALGPKEALIVFLCKSTLGALVTGNPGALLYSIPAGLAAYLVQLLLIRCVLRFVSVTSVSLSGAVVFNAVQLGIASLVAGVSLYVALPLFLAASVAAGAANGILVYLLIRYLPPSAYPDKPKDFSTTQNPA